MRAIRKLNIFLLIVAVACTIYFSVNSYSSETYGDYNQKIDITEISMEPYYAYVLFGFEVKNSGDKGVAYVSMQISVKEKGTSQKLTFTTKFDFYDNLKQGATSKINTRLITSNDSRWIESKTITDLQFCFEVESIYFDDNNSYYFGTNKEENWVEMKNDTSYHWVSDQSIKNSHSLSNGVCSVCGYNKNGGHTHTYSSEYSTSSTHHWYSTTCGCNEKKDYATHTFNSSGVCVCGYKKTSTHTHNYSTLKKDGESHWYECSCGDKNNSEKHKGGTATCTTKAKCSVCGESYGSLKSHTYSSQYTTSNTHHWYSATCGCDLKKDYEAHTWGGDGKCKKCFTTMPVTSGVIYDKSSDGTYAEVIGYDGTATEIRIADTYEGLPVKTIYDEAFYRNYSITTVIIPDSVTSIGDEAFYNCSSLKSVTIGDSVTSIGEYAFYNCSSLTSVTIGDSVTSIGSSAFRWCSSLTSVTIGDSVTSIGDAAFEYCSSLTSVTLGDSVRSIGDDAFSGCASISYNNVKYIGDRDNPYAILIRAENKNLSTYTIHEKTKYIYNGAFSDCDRLSSIEIPDSVTSIGYSAFSGCDNLKTLNYTGTIDQWAQISFIRDADANPMYYTHNLYINNELVTKVNITTATKISDFAFYGCSSLTSVTIGDSVTSIGYSAFCGCNSLTSVTIGDSVTSIGNYAFSDCSSLTSIVIPDSVTSIGYGAFCDCSSLTSITFKDTSTWYRTSDWDDWMDMTGGSQVDVTNPSSNASYLKNQYYYYYWYKK